MTQNLRLALIIVFLFQLSIIAGFELAHDEAYYWLYSRNLDWGYFDHPPFVGVVIRLFSFLPHSEFAVRIGFVLLQFATLFLLLTLTTHPWITFALFFSFPLASFAGLLALPDMPLLFMTACYCLQLKNYLEEDSLKNSVLLGLIIALLFYAKYHGALVVFFTLLALPSLFLRRSFYQVALVGLIGFFPHILWQYQYDFSTLRYHFLERPSSSFSFKRVMEYLGLQIGLAGLFAGPIVWWGVIKTKTESAFDRAMKSICVGTVLFFLFSSFSKRVEANWSIFLAVPLICLAAPLEIWKKKSAQMLLGSSLALVLLTRLLFVLPPESIPLKRLKEFHGWKLWAIELRSLCGEKPLLANTYQIASKLSYYLNTEVSALNYLSRKNQFDYWRFDRALPTKEVCYITDNDEFSGEILVTPEGKTLRVVKNKSIEELWRLK